jgi:hypothetical protein
MAGLIPVAGSEWGQAGLSFLLYFVFAISFGVGMFTMATSIIFVVLVSTLVRVRRELYLLLFAFAWDHAVWSIHSTTQGLGPSCTSHTGLFN